MRDALVVSSNVNTLIGTTGPAGSSHDQSGISGNEWGADDQQGQNTKESSRQHGIGGRERKGMKCRDGDYQSRFVWENAQCKWDHLLFVRPVCTGTIYGCCRA
jgi:hypothetical protein